MEYIPPPPRPWPVPARAPAEHDTAGARPPDARPSRVRPESSFEVPPSGAVSREKLSPRRVRWAAAVELDALPRLCSSPGPARDTDGRLSPDASRPWRSVLAAGSRAVERIVRVGSEERRAGKAGRGAPPAREDELDQRDSDGPARVPAGPLYHVPQAGRGGPSAGRASYLLRIARAITRSFACVSAPPAA